LNQPPRVTIQDDGTVELTLESDDGRSLGVIGGASDAMRRLGQRIIKAADAAPALQSESETK